jgi:hypothetical protein
MQTESTTPDPARGERIIAVRILPAPESATGLVMRDDGVLGVAVGGTAIVLGLLPDELRQVAGRLNEIADKLDQEPPRAADADLAEIMAQVGPVGVA